MRPSFPKCEREDGHELDDWLQAESEATQEKTKAVPLKPAFAQGSLRPDTFLQQTGYIADSLDENISLSQLAAIAGMSPHYFLELFKQSTGRAPHNYVLLQRIERAKQQLRDPKRSIVDAALYAGFQNPSHFARVFRKLEGTTPSKFRADYVLRPTLQKFVDGHECFRTKVIYVRVET